MRLYKIFTFGLFILIGMHSIVGCRKKKDTSAVITVKDSSGAVVSGAQVRLYPVSTQPGSTIDTTVAQTAYTNPNGTARFSFNDTYQLGQAGVVVLNIKAISNGSIGEGIIKIEEETETEETVYI